MPRISQRISEKLKSVVSTVRCPACGKHVVPTFVSGDESGDAEQGIDGKRWSFVWRPPRGQGCPECGFPLERYARRAKWIRLFTLGVAIVAVSLVFIVLAMVSEAGSGLMWWMPVISGAIGMTALLVGLVGVVLGGRH